MSFPKSTGGGSSDSSDSRKIHSKSDALYYLYPNNPERRGSIFHPRTKIKSDGALLHSDINKIFTICVVGLSGSEQFKLGSGVGKSCLCNRFVQPYEDLYRTDHISTLSAVDFGGRVINNDHWLYWGERTLALGHDPTTTTINSAQYSNGSSSSEATLTIRIVEQTEFVDDISFQTFKSDSGIPLEPYTKRCSSLKLVSADKLMYICKDQLGLESEFEKKPLPDGKLTIDGFLCLIDVSRSLLENQSAFVTSVLQNLSKTKKPILLVTTKNDELDEKAQKQLEKMLSKKECKGLSSNIVETSANLDVNVELAFILLSHLIDKNFVPKPKTRSFKESLKLRQKIVNECTTNFMEMLNREVRESRASWPQVRDRLSNDPDFQNFIDFLGTPIAKVTFEQYIDDLRMKKSEKRRFKQLQRLPDIFEQLLKNVDTVKDRPWVDVVESMVGLPNFRFFFRSADCSTAQIEINGMGSQDLIAQDDRLPFDLLCTAEAENQFRSVVAKIERDQQAEKLQRGFIHLLQNCTQVTPGKPIEDAKIFFIGKDCYEALNESEAQMIYDQYQRQIIRQARRDFMELLLENVDEFASKLFTLNATAASNFRLLPIANAGAKAATAGATTNSDAAHRLMTSSMRDVSNISAALGLVGVAAPSASVSQLLSDSDWSTLNETLREDFRYRHMNKMHQVRENMMKQFASFIRQPLNHQCPAESACIDLLVEDILDNYISKPFLTKDIVDLKRNDVNLLIVDTDGMGHDFVVEIERFLAENQICINDRTFQFNYDFVSIDALSSLSIIDLPNHSPDNIVYVFSTSQSFDEMSELLTVNNRKKSILIPTESISNNNYGNGSLLVFSETPITLVLGQQNFIGAGFSDLIELKKRAKSLAMDLKMEQKRPCSFYGVEKLSEMSFSPEQIRKVLQRACESKMEKCLQNQSKSSLGDLPINIVVCMMCGDDFSPELVMQPFLKCRYCSNVKFHSTVDKNEQNPNSQTINETRSIDCEITLQNCNNLVENKTISRKVVMRITFSSYHSLISQMGGNIDGTLTPSNGECKNFDGFIGIYSTQRQASFSHLSCLTRLMVLRGYRDLAQRLAIVAVGDVTEFFSNSGGVNNLLTKGNDLSDRLGARLLTLSKSTDAQMNVFGQFLTDVLQWKETRQKLQQQKGPSSSYRSNFDVNTLDLDFSTFRSKLSTDDSGIWTQEKGQKPMKETASKLHLPKNERRATTWYTTGSSENLSSDQHGGNSNKSLLSENSKINISNRYDTFRNDSSFSNNPKLELESQYMTVKDALGIYRPENDEEFENEAQYATLGSVFLRRQENNVIDSKNTSSSHVQNGVKRKSSEYDVPDIDCGGVPSFIKKCVEFIEHEGLTTEGLYRVPGNQSQVLEVEKMLKENPQLSLLQICNKNNIPVNVVTTVLKNYFSSLDQSIIPATLYQLVDEAVAAADLHEQLRKIKEICQKLPELNRSTLRYLISHLRKVARNSVETAMDYRNLAKCWWPTLIRPQFDTFESMALMTQKLENFVQLLLEYAEFIFSPI